MGTRGPPTGRACRIWILEGGAYVPGWSTSFSRGDGSTHRQAPHAVAHERVHTRHASHTRYTESPLPVPYWLKQKRVCVGPKINRMFGECTLYLLVYGTYPYGFISTVYLLSLSVCCTARRPISRGRAPVIHSHARARPDTAPPPAPARPGAAAGPDPRAARTPLAAEAAPAHAVCLGVCQRRKDSGR